MQLINDLSVKLKRYEVEINETVARVMRSGWLVLGPEVDRFEAAFANYHACDHCVGVANGTDALELALRALGVNSNSLVATVANAGAYTTTAASCIGASLLYMEVEESSQCVTFESVKAALDAGADVIVVTHLFGRVVPDIKQIAALCEERNIPLVEDCAQAHGASLGGRLAGAFGSIASFSFYPTKNLGALGDGGAVVTNVQEYADKVRQLRQYGWKGKYEIGIDGGRNSRLDTVQAAVLSDFLLHLDTWNDERIEIAVEYNKGIVHPMVIKPRLESLGSEKGGRPYVAHLYVIQSSQRDSLKKHLEQREIMSEVHYPIPDHHQAVVSGSAPDLQLPVTDRLAETILTLPCYPGMSQDQVNHVIESVNSWAV